MATANRTAPKKAHSRKPSPKSRRKAGPIKLTSPTPRRKPTRHRAPTFVEGLREAVRDAPAVTAIGKELRSIAIQLERVESHIIVCRLALDGQNAEHDKEVASLLRLDVGDLLYRQIRSLENIAAKCDGEARSDREDDDTEGQP